jgi:thiol-disulfide isomerase/thioredoxin
MKYTQIKTFDELENLKSSYKHIILRFSTNWCTGCVKIKDEINNFIKELDFDEAIFVDVDFDSYQNDIDFQEYIWIDKLPTFYCINKFKYNGIDIDIIKSSIISLKGISEDF